MCPFRIVWLESTPMHLSPDWSLRVGWTVPCAWPFNALNENAPDVGGRIRTNLKAVGRVSSATVQLYRIIHHTSVMNVRICHAGGWGSWISVIVLDTAWAWSQILPRLKIRASTRSWFIKPRNIHVPYAEIWFVSTVPVASRVTREIYVSGFQNIGSMYLDHLCSCILQWRTLSRKFALFFLRTLPAHLTIKK